MNMYQQWPDAVTGQFDTNTNNKYSRAGLAKHGDGYFLPIYGFLKDPIVAPAL